MVRKDFEGRFLREGGFMKGGKIRSHTLILEAEDYMYINIFKPDIKIICIKTILYICTKGLV